MLLWVTVKMPSKWPNKRGRGFGSRCLRNKLEEDWSRLVGPPGKEMQEKGRPGLAVREKGHHGDKELNHRVA